MSSVNEGYENYGLRDIPGDQLTDNTKEIENAKSYQNNSKSWKQLVIEYTEVTTCQGIRYITEPTRYPHRRVAWILIVLASFVCFLALTGLTLRRLGSNEKSVNIDVNYNQTLPFPAVTVCNMNLFKLTSLFENSLNELVIDDYLDDLDTGLEQGDEYIFTGVQCVWPRTKEDDVDIKKVSRLVCRRLCSSTYSKVCAGFFFNPLEKSCRLGLHTGLSMTEIQCDNPKLEFHRRNRGTYPFQPKCTFEYDDCFLTYEVDWTERHSNTYLPWKRKMANWSSLSVKPSVDSTSYSREGFYLVLHTVHVGGFKKSKGYIRSDFYDFTGMCLSFSFNARASKSDTEYLSYAFKTYYALDVYIIDENGNQINLNASTQKEDHPLTTPDWYYVKIKLPDGIYKINIVGQLHEISTVIVVDDIEIQRCQESECVHNMRGIDYHGRMNRSRSGKPCLDWGFISTELGLDIVKDDSKNSCRYPDMSANVLGQTFNSPVCVVDDGMGEFEMEDCEIPYCECSLGENSCIDGSCLDEKLFCNGVLDCDDGSDEADCSNNSLTCSLVSWLCGYTFTSNIKWNNGIASAVIPNLESGGYMFLSASEFDDGERATIFSPMVTIHQPALFEFLYYLHNYEYTAPTLSVYLIPNGSLAISEQYLLERVYLYSYGGWRETRMCLPQGTYRIQLTAEVWRKLEYLAIGNLSLLENHVCNASFTFPPTVISKNISCDFGDGSMCGYVSSSSLASASYQMMSYNLTLPYHITSGVHDMLVLAASIQSLFYSKSHWIDLISPQWRSRHNQCLVINAVFRDNFDVILKHFSDGSLVRSDILVRVRQNQGNSWNRLMATIIADANVDRSVMLRSQAVSGIATKGNISCDFSSESCGYMSDTSNSIAWTRESDSRGFFIGAVMTEIFQGKASLLSPYEDISDDNVCLTVNYEMIGVLSRFSISVAVGIIWRNGTWRHITKLDPWMDKAMIRLPMGKLRLVISLAVKIPLEKNSGIKIRSLALGSGICEGVMSCAERALDIVFIVDSSASINSNDWKEIIMFLKQIVSMLKIGPNYSLVGLVTFGWKAHTIWTLGSITSKSSLMKAIENVPFDGSTTNTYDGLLLAMEQFNSTYNRPFANDIAILITDGHPTVNENLTHSAVALYHNSPVTLLPIGVTAVVSTEFIISFAEAPKIENENYLMVQSFKDLNTVMAKLIRSACLSGNVTSNAGVDNYDEISPSQDTTTPISNSRMKRSGRSLSSIYNYLFDTYGDISVYDIFWNNSPSLDDVLISCEFEGQPCLNNSLKEELTNYGKCFTFNHDSVRPYRTAATGAGSGLKLIMDAGSYDKYYGNTIMTGLKVLLHDQDNVADISGLGATLQPGKYNFGSMTYSKTAMLPAPFSDCVEDMAMKYYSSPFTTAKCTHDCQTINAITKCECQDHYMTDLKPCTCPNACEVKLYNMFLSYGDIDVRNMAKIANQTTWLKMIKNRSNKALDLQGRLNPITFKSTIESLEHLVSLEGEALGLTTEFSSMMSAVQIDTFTSMSLIADIINNDTSIHSPLEKMSLYFKAYLKYLQPLVERILANCDILKLLLIEFLNLPDDDTTKNDTIATLNKVTTVLAKDEILIQRILTRPSNVYLPHFLHGLNTNNEIGTHPCDNYISKIIEATINLSVEIKHLNQGYATLIDDLLDHLYAFTVVNECYSSYGNFLKEIKDINLKLSVNYTEDALKMQYGLDEQIQITEEDWKFMSRVLDIYQTATNDTLTLDEIMTSEINYRALGKDLNEIIASIHTQFAEQIIRILDRFRSQAVSNYQTVLNLSKQMHQYFPNASFTEKVKGMTVWREPYIIFTTQQDVAFKYDRNSLWKVWPNDMSLEMFVSSKGQQHIREFLDQFVVNLLFRLKDIEEITVFLKTNRNEFKIALQSFVNKLNLYRLSTNIDEYFARKNLLTLDLFYGEKKYEFVRQQPSYDLSNFFSDLGGNLGLLLGGTVITIFEVLDLVIYNSIVKCSNRRKRQYSMHQRGS